MPRLKIQDCFGKLNKLNVRLPTATQKAMVREVMRRMKSSTEGDVAISLKVAAEWRAAVEQDRDAVIAALKEPEAAPVVANNATTAVSDSNKNSLTENTLYKENESQVIKAAGLEPPITAPIVDPVSPEAEPVRERVKRVRKSVAKAPDEAKQRAKKSVQAEVEAAPIPETDKQVLKAEAESIAPEGSEGARKLRAAMEGLFSQRIGSDSILRSQPLGVTYRRGIPVEKQAALLDAAQSLIAEGVRTPEGLAAELTKLSVNARQYSEAIWRIFGSVDPELPATADWNAIYERMDGPVKKAPAYKPKVGDWIVDAAGFTGPVVRTDGKSPVIRMEDGEEQVAALPVTRMDNPDQPALLETQTDADIEAERQRQADAERQKKQADAMRDRAAAPLTGKDTTGQGALFAEDADLFSGPSAEESVASSAIPSIVKSVQAAFSTAIKETVGLIGEYGEKSYTRSGGGKSAQNKLDQVIKDVAWRFFGPSLVERRQEFIEEITGSRPPKSGAGVEALKGAISTWLTANTPIKSEMLRDGQSEIDKVLAGPQDDAAEDKTPSGQRRAAPGGEYGPNGEWYPGGSFIATTQAPKGEDVAPSGRKKAAPIAIPADPENLRADPPAALVEDADAYLQGKGIVVTKSTTGTGKTVWRVSGKTFDHKDTLKELGARWYAPEKSWSIFANENPTQKIADALAGKPAEGDKQGSPANDTASQRDADEDRRLRELREREDGRSDERRARGDAVASVDESTSGLIRRGLKYGIPSSVVEDQIEDVGMIVHAWNIGKPMFLLANEAGTGKTFVLGGAIRELRRAGAPRFVYVTMNTDLVAQIRRDLADFGVDDVQFMTYSELSNKYAPETDGAVVIFDEAHNVKNAEAARAGKAQPMMARAKMTIFASATPFENPVQAAYLGGTGVFNSAGGHTEWGKAYGANVKRRTFYNPNTGREEVEETLYWTQGKLEDGLAARQWFMKQGVMTQRKMQLPMDKVDVDFVKGAVEEKWVTLYNRVTQAYEEAMAPYRNEDGSVRDAQANAQISMHMTNTVKRILEASKVPALIEAAKDWLARKDEAGNPYNIVAFVETKADRFIGRYAASEFYEKRRAGRVYEYPQMVEMMTEWAQAAGIAKAMKEKAPPRPFAQFIMDIAGAMHAANIDEQLPSVEEEIVAALGGTDDVGVYTGSVTATAATKAKQDFLAGRKRALVATMAKGGTGLSLHDVVGNRPTVQLNINLPWVATGVDQVGGRVARYGLQSKALIRWMFASNIPFERMLAGRVGTRMRDMGALVKGIEVRASTQLTQNFDFEGSVSVKQLEGEVSAPESDVFEQAERLEKTRVQPKDTSNGFFETPYPLAALMSVVSGARGSVLEPSAGRGSLLKFIPQGSQVTAVEMRSDNLEQLRKAHPQAVQGDFLSWAAGNSARFDTILMNPPFERIAGVGAQDVAHVMQAYEMLAPGGRLTAIMGEGAFFRDYKQEKVFREWLNDVGAVVVKLPEGAFKNSGTGVRTRMVVIDRGGPAGRTDLALDDMASDSLRDIAEAIPPHRQGTLSSQRLTGPTARLRAALRTRDTLLAKKELTDSQRAALRNVEAIIVEEERKAGQVFMFPEELGLPVKYEQPALFSRSFASMLKQAGVDLDALDEATERASLEEPGHRTVGRPDLSLGAEDQRIMGVDEVRDPGEESIEQWDKQAADMLANDYEGTVRMLMKRGRKTGADAMLNPVETRAAQMIVARESRKKMTRAQNRRMQWLVWSYRNAGTEQARGLASRRDPFKTPAERHREFLMRVIFTPPPAVRKAIEKADGFEEKERIMIEQANEIDRIKAELARMGVSLDDLFGGEVALTMKGSPVAKAAVASMGSAMRRKAAEMLMEHKGEGTAAKVYQRIAKETGMKLPDVQRVHQELLATAKRKTVEAMMARIEAARAARDGALKSQPIPRPDGAVGLDIDALLNMSPEQLAAAVDSLADNLVQQMGILPPAKLGRMKAVKRRRKPIFFVPPPRRDEPAAAAPEATQPAAADPDWLGRPVPRTGFGVQPRLEGTTPPAWEGGTPGLGQNQRGWLDLGDMAADESFTGDATEWGRRLFPDAPAWEGEMLVPVGADMGKIEDVVSVARAAGIARASGLDMLVEFWINNLLSGPTTHIRNLAGNLTSMLWGNTLQRGVETLMRGQPAEMVHLWKGLMPGIARGWRLAKMAWKHQADFYKYDMLDAQVEFDGLVKGEGSRAAIPGRFGDIVRMPGRLLAFSDSLFKGILAQMEAGSQAYRIAKAEGLSGNAMVKRMNQELNTPGSQAWQLAVEKAEDATFQTPLKRIGDYTDKAAGPTGYVARTGEHLASVAMETANSIKLLRFIIPFVRTPFNILRTGIRMSPVGSMTLAEELISGGFAKFKHGKAMTSAHPKLVQHAAEQIIAWTAAALLAGAVEGDDEDEDQWLLITGTRKKGGEADLQARTYPATSIRIGGKWFNYGSIEPIATALGLFADAVRSRKIGSGSLVASLRGQIDGKTFLQGLSQAWDNAERMADGKMDLKDAALKQALTLLVPNLIRQPVKAWDGTERDWKSKDWWYDAFPSGDGAAPRVNTMTGEEVQKPGNVVTRLLFPFLTEAPEQIAAADKMLMAWNRKNPGDIYAPQEPARKLQVRSGQPPVDLGPKAYEYLQKRSAVLARQRMPGYRKDVDERTLKAIKAAVEDGRDLAREELRRWPAAKLAQ